MGNNSSIKDFKERVSGKAKRAVKRLEVLEKDQNNVIEKLISAQEKLSGLLPEDSKASNNSKQRSMVSMIPERIEFYYNGLKFFIDFTIESFDQENIFETKGCIIYGVKRTLSFLQCIQPDKNHKNCEIISRCDRLEDKPLIKFSVNHNGLIQSTDRFEDELWNLNDDDNDLVNLHVSALDKIWVEALAWTNETLLP